MRTPGIIIFAILWLFALSAWADPFSMPVAPDLNAAFISVSYNSTTHDLTADGFSLTLDGTPVNNGPGLFHLDAVIGNDGALAGGGSLSITDGNSVSLLAGNLYSFSYDASALGFIFDVTGGSLQSQYGAHAGVLLHASGYNGSFSSNFDNSGISDGGMADVGTVPEPATILILGTGALVAIMGKAVRQKRP